MAGPLIQSANPTQMTDYRSDCPTEEHVRELLPYAIEMWRERNVFIRKIRETLDGENAVTGPAGQQYTVKVTHNFLLRQAVSEKEARFLPMPVIQAVTNSASTEARRQGTELEDGLNSLQYEMEAQGDGDVWSRLVSDAIPYDIAVERIECCPALFWPELVADIDHGKEKLSLTKVFESTEDYQKYRDQYKKNSGCPFRSVYVQPEMYLPIREGTFTVESFEIEERSLREVLNNPVYDVTRLRNRLAVVQASAKQVDLLKQKCTIIHYSNLNWHCYFIMAPGLNSPTIWPRQMDPEQIATGSPLYLHGYQHGIGRVIYNEMGGRYGGWKTGQNRIEGVINALAQINQDADEISSQVLTNIRNVYWPQLVAYYDPMQRDPTDGLPKPPTLKEGQSISMWKGEELKPLFMPAENPVLTWFFENLMKQHERLAGSVAVYGTPPAGATSGFHVNMQVSQAEHLDDKLETAFVHGAIQRIRIILAYICRMDEKVWVNHRMVNDDGRRYGNQIELDPVKLQRPPQFDAIVKRVRPIDYTAGIRAALDASADRHGPGTPLLDDDTIRERLLGETAPDIIARKILIQNERQKLIDAGFIQKLIEQKTALKVEQSGQRTVSPETAGNADPALMQTLGMQNAQTDMAAQKGGVKPPNLLAMMQGGGKAMFNQPGAPLPIPPGGAPGPFAQPQPGAPPAQPVSQGMGPNSPRLGVGGGPVAGQPQPEQNAARMIQAITRSGV